MTTGQHKLLNQVFTFLAIFFVGVGFLPTANADEMVTLQVRNEVEEQIILPDTLISVEENDTALGILIKKFGKKVKCKDYGVFKYVVEIDGLREYKYGPMSGWMYEINNKRPDEYPASYTVQAGDRIIWTFVRGY